MRITHGMVSGQYARGLNKALNALNAASKKSTSFRRFDTVAEDPFSAAKAYRLRREYQANANYQTIAEDVESRFLTAQSAMMSLNTLVQEVLTGDTIQAVNGTLTRENRQTVAEKLRTLQKSLVSILNTKFADQYLFAGSGSSEIPFSVGENGRLLYHGIDVDTGILADGTTASFNNMKIVFGNETGGDLNGWTVKIVDGGAGAADTVTADGNTLVYTADLSAGRTNADLLAALKSASGLADASGNPIDLSGIRAKGDTSLVLTDGMLSGPAYDRLNPEELAELSRQPVYVDLGMGMRFGENRNAVAQSVFNVSLPGIAFSGFGNNDGVPNNVYNLISDIAEALESENYSTAEIQKYIDALSNQSQQLLSYITKSGTDSNYLKTLTERLESEELNIIEKLNNVEFIDPATAIMDYKMQEYAYNAALQMGTKIMQRSILDYLD